MSGTQIVIVGDKGRVVVPADIRERAGLTVGTTLIMFETPAGLVLMTREQLRSRVRDDLSGSNLVDDLLAGRRREAAGEDTP
jgi:AbrB family looped-hinge helix DNA binding protein